MKHLLSLEKLEREDMEFIIENTISFKKLRGKENDLFLKGQTWALLFSKSSTRTRVSFEVGLRELGANVIFLNARDIQLGRGEPIKDTARVLGRMVHGAIIRTYAQSEVEEFAEYSNIPTINALTDDEHPCQILTDIFTFQEFRGSIKGKTVSFFGDGASNVANSWMFAAAKLGFNLKIAAPLNFQPSENMLKKLQAFPDNDKGASSEKGFVLPSGSHLTLTESRESAAKDSDLLYTDVWVSMGKEAESEERIKQLSPYQLNKTIVSLANKGALVMHCLPAYRGKEIDDETFEQHSNTIFTQAENRLHTQKSILRWITL
ncbi:MAG: ornithine carbamoyltransferase [Verrucomicrobiia bacterium]